MRERKARRNRGYKTERKWKERKKGIKIESRELLSESQTEKQTERERDRQTRMHTLLYNQKRKTRPQEVLFPISSNLPILSASTTT